MAEFKTGDLCRTRRTAPGYDRLPERSWLFVPMWGIVTWFLYAPRRVQCPEHGVVVEHIPWSEGKRPITTAMMCFLARWARLLNWFRAKGEISAGAVKLD